MKLVLKKVAKKLSYSKRHLALTSKEQVDIKKLKYMLLYILININNEVTKEKELDFWKECFTLTASKYLQIVVDPCESTQRIKYLDRTIASFSLSNTLLHLIHSNI